MREMLSHKFGTEAILHANKITDRPTGPKAATMDSLVGPQDTEVEPPVPTEMIPTGPEKASEAPKRRRRTKAEMEAAATKNPEETFDTKQHDTRAEVDESPAALQQNGTAKTPVVNKQTVHEALQQVNVAVGLPKAREILTHFKVQRMSELKPEDYAAFIEKCNEATMMA